jgi:hypothetical protein
LKWVKKTLTAQEVVEKNFEAIVFPNPKPNSLMKMIKPLAVTAALISAASFAHALAPAKMDANKDGAVSKEEFLAFYAPIDRLVDKNGDGFVVIEEWSARERHHFAPNDQDKDGRLSLEEIANMRLGHFKVMDKNGNGILESEI